MAAKGDDARGSFRCKLASAEQEIEAIAMIRENGSAALIHAAQYRLQHFSLCSAVLALLTFPLLMVDRS